MWYKHHIERFGGHGADCITLQKLRLHDMLSAGVKSVALWS